MSMMNKLNNKFVSGINTQFEPNTINFCIAMSLILILGLVYLKYKKIELFYDNHNIMPTHVSFIDKALQMIQYKKQYLSTMATQEQKIQDISNQLSNLINK